MNDAVSTTRTLAIESVAIGEQATRISSALVVLLCLLPAVTTILFGGVDSITWVLITVFAFAVFLLWAIETWRARGLLINVSALLLPIVGLMALGLAQLLLQASVHPYGTRILIARLGVLTIFFAACLTFLNTEKRLRRVVVFVLIFGSAMAFIGILQRLADPDSIYGLRTGFQAIPFGPFVNQHHFATFMEMTGGLALGLLLGSLPRDKKVLVGIALVIMLIALILTGSRGGMLSFMVVTGVCLAARALFRVENERLSSEEEGALPRKYSAVLGAAAVVVGLIGAIIFIGGDRSLIRGIGLSDAPADVSNGRLHFWSIALRIFTDHPLIGAGLDAYGLAFPTYDTWNGGFRTDHAHNEYLQTLAEGGLVGGIIVGVFLFLFFRGSINVIRRTKAGLRRDIAIGAFAGGCGLLVHSLFDFPLRTWSNAFFFLLMITLATVAIPSAKDSNGHRRRKHRSNERERGSPSSRTAART